VNPIPTMQDVARLAGVSTKTVSNVINDRPYVSAETRDRVHAAITQLDYKLNLAARNLRSGRSGVIGLAVPTLTVAYFAELAEAVIAAAEQHQLAVQIARTGDAAREREFLASARLQHVDGLILSPMDHRSEELDAVDLSVPTVVLGDHPVGGAAVYVSSDQRAAAELATSHLIRIGRRCIAALGARSSVPGGAGALRLQGYRDALHTAGIPYDPALVVEADVWDRADGASAMRQLIDRGVAFDSVFAFNDSLALGAMRTLDDNGLGVPHDVSVIGIDNVAEARYSIPSLTTVDLGGQAIAETAVRLLAEQLTDPEAIAEHRIMIDFALVERESTAH
jgi:DNA-binding LacI/PurR family transcriptional regulator